MLTRVQTYLDFLNAVTSVYRQASVNVRKTEQTNWERVAFVKSP